jgi:hypothetical protein
VYDRAKIIKDDGPSEESRGLTPEKEYVNQKITFIFNYVPRTLDALERHGIYSTTPF